jgi:hypothetical protein
MADDHFITDINYYQPNTALAAVMAGTTGTLRLFLGTCGTEVKNLYQGHVAKRSGRLASSAESHVEDAGGHDHDRMVAKVTVGGTIAVAPKPWHGEPFYYGVLHDLGSPTKDQFQAAKDLSDVLGAFAAVNGHVNT